VKELLGYVFLATEGGRHALYRGSGNGLAPIPACCADEMSLGCVEQLKHRICARKPTDADWAARPAALTHYTTA